MCSNETEQALDREFCNYLEKGGLFLAREMLPSYVKATGVEGGRRFLAMLLGDLQRGKYTGVLHGHGPSSGSGNGVITMRPAI